MGIVWEAYHKGGPMGVPENPTENLGDFFSFQPSIFGILGCLKHVMVWHPGKVGPTVYICTTMYLIYLIYIRLV